MKQKYDNTQSLMATTKQVSNLSMVYMIVAIILAISTLGLSLLSYANEEKISKTQTYNRMLKEGSDYLTSQVRLYAMTGDKQYYENYWEEVNTVKSRDKALNAIIALGAKESELAIIQEAKADSDQLIVLEEEAMAAVEEGDLSKAQLLVAGDTYNAAKSKIDGLTVSFEEAVLNRVRREAQIVNIVLVIVCLLAIASIGLALRRILIYNRRIVHQVIEPVVALSTVFKTLEQGELHQPIEETEDKSEVGELIRCAQTMQTTFGVYIEDITYILKEIGNGNLKVQSGAHYEGDFVRLKEANQKIIQALNDTIFRIRQATDEVSMSATEIAKEATELATCTIEQGKVVESFRVTVEAVADNIEESMEEVKKATAISSHTKERAIEGQDIMDSMLEAMNKISTSSHHITEIIKIINNIADQTHLLALNASIESARAGEAGKGFAVVSREIGGLATMSVQTVKEINHIAGQSLESINEGIMIVQNTVDTFKEIVVAVEDTADITHQLLEKSHKQKEAMNQLLEGAKVLTKVVEENNASSQTSAAVSQELASQAEMLRRLIQYFAIQE